ncbi:MAG: hypothetical protein ACRD22_10170 [Terriglobia bacterium]
MNQTGKPRAEDLADELDWWKKLREMRQAKGLDVAQFIDESASEVEHGLHSPGGKEDFAELCEAGCLSKGLAALVFVLQRVPVFESVWTELVGDPANRVKTAASLEIAAQTLEKLYGAFIESETQTHTESFTKMGRIPISNLVSELRLHVKVINAASMLSVDTEARSLGQVARYLLTAYVKQMTGDFHDRSVSGLIAELLGSPDYNEVAHRMWRRRNYERLDQHCAWMANILAVASVVVHHAA